MDFKCRVKVQGCYSRWYSLRSGIHQGGYLWLYKYVAYVNSLLVELHECGSCVRIYKSPSTPVSYADDMSACRTSKYKMDHVMDTVYRHGRRWSYDYNAETSAVLTYVVNKHENTKFSKERVFRRGKERVVEKTAHDHAAVKACIFPNDDEKISDSLSKARRTLNGATGIGIRNNGLKDNSTMNKTAAQIVSYGILYLNPNSHQCQPSFKEYIAVLTPP